MHIQTEPGSSAAFCRAAFLTQSGRPPGCVKGLASGSVVAKRSQLATSDSGGSQTRSKEDGVNAPRTELSWFKVFTLEDESVTLYTMVGAVRQTGTSKRGCRVLLCRADTERTKRREDVLLKAGIREGDLLWQEETESAGERCMTPS